MLVLPACRTVGVWRAEPDKPRPPTSQPCNLVANGDFEAGDATPSGWQTIDGLSSFWVKDADPKHGKVLKFDTDVYHRKVTTGG